MNARAALAAAGLCAGLALASFGLGGCSTSTTTTTAAALAVATDVTAIIGDINSAAAGKTLTEAQLATITADVTKLQNDVTALNAGSTTTTVTGVLADVTSVATDVGPFLPAIEAMISMAAPAPGGVPHPVSKAQIDYIKLQVDATS
jgi:hypothetical protein